MPELVIHLPSFVLGFVVQIIAHLLRVGLWYFENDSRSPVGSGGRVSGGAIVAVERLVYGDCV